MHGKYFSQSAIFFRDHVHKDIQRKFINEAEMRKEVQEAAELESILQDIKRYVDYLNGFNTTHNSSALKYSFVEDLLGQFSEKNRKELFYYKGMKPTEAGEAFENNLISIIDAALKINYPNLQASSSLNGIGFMALGKIGAMPKTSFSYQELLEELGPVLLKQISGYLTEDFNGDYYFKLKQGKIDVLSPTITSTILDINIATDKEKQLQRFYQLISDAKITAKNYRENEIRLGNTKPFKIYNSVLSYTNNYSSDEILKIFKAGIIVSKQSMSEEKELHKAHINIFYELTGPGLWYVDNDGKKFSLGECKFLIVNQRDGSGIRVLSTKEIINRMLNISSLEEATVGITYGSYKTRETGLTISYS